MKLNIGCGNDKLVGYTNVDKMPGCAPDKLVDIETDSWPWPDNSVDEIVVHHVLEHISDLIHVLKEMYRVLKIGGKVDIRVPHPRHDAFLGDPTHVRPILPGTLDLFSKKSNAKFREQKAPNTPLGEYHNIDFDLKSVDYALDEAWRQQVLKGELTMSDAMQAIVQLNNVCAEIHIVLEKAS